MNTPFFSITGNINWASEFCIQDFIDLLKGYGVKPTLFATHESAKTKQLAGDKAIEVGIHPDFLPNSSQGKDCCDIIDNLLRLYPDSKIFRAHSYFDNSAILSAVKKRG